MVRWILSMGHQYYFLCVYWVGKIHSPSHALNDWASDEPIGQVSGLTHFESSQKCLEHFACANHPERLTRSEITSSFSQPHYLFTCVYQVQIQFILLRNSRQPQHSILTLNPHILQISLFQIFNYHSRNSYSQIYHTIINNLLNTSSHNLYFYLLPFLYLFFTFLLPFYLFNFTLFLVILN